MRITICRVAVATVLAVCTVSCSNRSDDATDLVKLSSDEVASLLGIQGKEDITISSIESGREGVKVKSISLKNRDTEIEVDDVDLRIVSSGKLTYAISYLQIGKLDVLDWSSTQRAQAFGVRVDKPGDGFLSKLEAAISAVRAGASLRTKALSCEKLTIDKIVYQIRPRDAEPTKVTIDTVSIAEATTETIGELSVGLASVGENVGGKGLRVTKVDRVWADQLLALMVARPGSEKLASSPSDQVPAFGGKYLPFDHVEVAEMNFRADKHEADGYGALKLTDLNLDVKRQPEGQLTGIEGRMKCSAEITLFGEATGVRFFRAIGNPQFERSVAGSLRLKLVTDISWNIEENEIFVGVPGLGALSGSATTRNLAGFLSMLIAQQKPPEHFVKMSSTKLEFRDDGLFIFLLSDRFNMDQDNNGEKCRDGMRHLPDLFNKEEDHQRLIAEISEFVQAPGVVRYVLQSNELMDIDKFLNGSVGHQPTLSFLRK